MSDKNNDPNKNVIAFVGGIFVGLVFAAILILLIV